MKDRTVLISGGGVAGTTLAYWLARRGLVPTVVERAAGLRSSGSPVDVRDGAVPVVERMGVMPRLRDAATQVTRLTFVDGNGARVGGLDLQPSQKDGERAVELPRADLAAILYDTGRSEVEYLFGDSVAAIEQDERGVDVTFERAEPRRFDLVVGADGLHSRVRRLVFGPVHDHIRYLGMYVATVALDTRADSAYEVVTYNTPGRAVSVHPARDHAVAAFMFRRPEVVGFDHRDDRQHRRMLAETFDGGGWRVPELLHTVRHTEDLYLDAVSRVSLPRWSSGRVVLVGDAASCVSLFGDGSTLAITGAAALADAVAEDPADHRAAIARYETVHRERVARKQRAMAVASRLLVPATATGIRTRNLATRAVTAAGVRRGPVVR